MPDNDHAYDAAVILGSRPVDGTVWELPAHVYQSLDRAVALYRQKTVHHIVVSGKWTINFDILGIRQPFTECDRMAEYLERHGIPPQAILREAESMDAISNLYYLKRHIFEPKAFRRLLFIAAGPRLARIEFLSKRILGPGYSLEYDSIGPRPGIPSESEARRSALQAAFLEPMRDGDDSWLDGRFYTGPYYDNVRTEVMRKADMEPYAGYVKTMNIV